MIQKILTQIETWEDFQKLVLDSKGSVMVVFSATWCGPCKVLKPIIKRLAQDFPTVETYVVDIDKVEKVLDACKVKMAPTTAYYLKGEVVRRIIGLDSEERYERLYRQALG